MMVQKGLGKRTVSSPRLSGFFTGLHTDARLNGFFGGPVGAIAEAPPLPSSCTALVSRWAGCSADAAPSAAAAVCAVLAVSVAAP